MNQPFKRVCARPKKRTTRLDEASYDLHFFKEMSDHEVLGCQFFWECRESGWYHIPASWEEECAIKKEVDTCQCRPAWYLKKMKDEYELPL
jgi:hypothetical protein